MNESKGVPQYVDVEQSFGIDPPIIHCPVCGSPVFEEGDHKGCGHLLFIYMPEAGGFTVPKDNLSNQLDEIDMDDELEERSWAEIFSSFGFDNKLLIISISYGGMGHGPIWYNDVYGFLWP